MTITREIHGETVTITLSEDELVHAAYEERKAEAIAYVSHIAETMSDKYHFEPETIRHAAAIYREAAAWNRSINRIHWDIGEYALKKALERQNAVC